jgi:hypothetical protein
MILIYSVDGRHDLRSAHWDSRGRPFDTGRRFTRFRPTQKRSSWNAEHIDALPPEIRIAVLAMCPTRPQAAHYFATYLDNSHRINLRFEKFHCEQRATLCNNAGCLHQVYAFANGHYRLAKSFYGPDND